MRIFLFLAAVFLAQLCFAQAPELVIPIGHSDNITCIAISADNKIIASGGWDKSVKLWDMAGNKELKTIGNFSSWIKAIAISPDGKKLVTGANKELRVNDISKGCKEIFKQSVSVGDINSICFSPDGKYIATSGFGVDGNNKSVEEVKIWDAATMALVGRTQTGERIKNIRFQNDDELLVIHYLSISTINLNTGLITKVETFKNIITELSPDGKIFASEGWDNDPKVASDDPNDPITFSKGRAILDIVDRNTDKVIKQFIGQTSSIKHAVFSNDGRYVLSAAGVNIYIYDLQEMKFSGKFDEKLAAAEALTFTRDGKKLITGHGDKIIMVWDFEGRKLAQKMGGEANLINNITSAPNGSVRVNDTTNVNRIALTNLPLCQIALEVN